MRRPSFREWSSRSPDHPRSAGSSCPCSCRSFPLRDGKVDTEPGPVAVTDVLNGAAHVACELGDQRKAKPPSLAFGRDERIEQVAANVGERKRTRLNSSPYCASRMMPYA